MEEFEESKNIEDNENNEKGKENNEKGKDDNEKGKEITTIDLNKEDTENKLSDILCRQTTLTKEEAIDLLRKHNYSLKLSLFEYNKIDNKNSVKSINQERYKLIRQTLDGKFNNFKN
tara:strand:- start:458 stop:808 length:351 start_codon:yes stop_codon:yes gene_type:complete